MMKLTFRLPATLRDYMRQYVDRPQFRPLSQSSDTDSNDSLLHHDEKPPSSPVSAWHHCRSLPSRRPILSFVLGGLLLLFVSAATFADPTRISGIVQDITQDSQFLYVLIPTSKASSTDACKTLLSAQILNYPNPWLLRWDADLDGPGKESKREYAKISLIADFLNNLPHSAQNATIIVLDGPGAWFQLRPEVLLKRYFEINRRANRALEKRMGKDTMEVVGMEQTVVFAAQTACEKGFPTNDTACYAVAPSPMQDGLRYINAGTAIGPVKHMRAIYDRVLLTAAQHDENDLHKVMAQTYGQQEYQREVIRQRHWSWLRHAWHSFALPFGGDGTILDYNLGYQRMDYLDGTPCEFGIGLDYDAEITFSTTEGVDAMKWEQHAASHVVLAADIKESMPPFWTVGDDSLPATSTWGDVDLLTNTLTNTVPAVIYHAPEKWWKNIWFQRHARQLFSDTIFLPASIVANFVDQTVGVERSFWHPKTTMARAGVRDAEGHFVHWQDLCGTEDLAEALFRDGKGVWHEPVH